MSEVAATFQGQPCRNGHGGLRYVRNRACIACQKDSMDRYRAVRGEEHTTYMRKYTSNWYSRNPQAKLWHAAKDRASEKNLEFSIRVEDIVIPDVCPLLEIPLYVGKGKVGPNSPTVDRIINETGYVPGNVWVISNAANTCKGQLRAAELLRIGVRLQLRENSVVL